MKLITKEIEQLAKKYGSQENEKDPFVIAKFFNPAGRGTWFMTEYNPKTRMGFGYISIFGDWNDEWGYFSIDELEEIQLPFGLSIERDKYCSVKRISEFNIPTLKK